MYATADDIMYASADVILHEIYVKYYVWKEN